MSTGGTAHPCYRFSESRNEDSTLDHALPTGHIDRLRFGLPGGPAVTEVYSTFVSIAMSAQIRGWTEVDFETEVTSRKCLRVNGMRRWVPHQLWCQLGELSRNPRRSLDDAWTQAAANLRSDGLHTLEDLRNTAVERAGTWQERLAGGTDDLDTVSAMVVEYVASQVEKRQMSQVTCQVREVAAHAGTSYKTAHRRLRALTERGLLICHSGLVRPPRQSIQQTGRYLQPGRSRRTLLVRGANK